MAFMLSVAAKDHWQQNVRLAPTVQWIFFFPCHISIDGAKAMGQQKSNCHSPSTSERAVDL